MRFCEKGIVRAWQCPRNTSLDGAALTRSQSIDATVFVATTCLRIGRVICTSRGSYAIDGDDAALPIRMFPPPSRRFQDATINRDTWSNGSFVRSPGRRQCLGVMREENVKRHVIRATVEPEAGVQVNDDLLRGRRAVAQTGYVREMWDRTPRRVPYLCLPKPSGKWGTLR